jgi:hypothetical protein
MSARARHVGIRFVQFSTTVRNKFFSLCRFYFDCVASKLIWVHWDITVTPAPLIWGEHPSPLAWVMRSPRRSYRANLGKTPHITDNDFLVGFCYMTDEPISHRVEPADAPTQGETNPPRRILLVDDDTAVRVFNKTVLTQAGY